MKKILFYVTLFITKILSVMLRFVSKTRGTNLPGSIAIKLCPDFLQYFILPEKVIAITGSNGKTSTTNFVNEILEQSKYKVLSNRSGSNMASGIATSLLMVSDLSGKCKEDFAVFEVDERGSSDIYKYITPTYLLCTNLFRDSIMRNGHSEFIKSKIEEKLPPETILILNADDLISASIGKNNKRIYFSVDKIDKESNDIKNNLAIDITACPKCMSKLQYDYIHYHHIGKAHCTSCDFSSPKADVLAANVDIEAGTLDIVENEEKYTYSFKVGELFNVYNIVAVITLFRELGFTHEDLREKTVNLSVKTTRKDDTTINGKRVVKMLSKDQNPISCSRAMDYVSQSDKSKAVILIIMNFKGRQDECEDISWLYDTDFEYLADESIKKIIVGGSRALDIKVRLRLAGVESEKIETCENCENMENMLDILNVEEIYILHSLYAASKAENLKNEILKKVEALKNE